MATDTSQTTHAKWKAGRQWGYAVWIADVAQLAFYVLLYTDRGRTARVVGLPAPTLGWVALLVVLLYLGHSVAMSVSSMTCYRVTGVVYGKDRLAFALAGGFDVGHWPTLVVQVAVYWALRWTVDFAPDPLAWLRTWWIYGLVSTGAGLVLTAIVGSIAFRVYRRRRPLTLLESLRGTLRFD
jgi:hypothetical protein